MRTAIFRCDATPEIGSGHVMRCLALAEYMRGQEWDCLFSVSEGTARVVPFLAQAGFKITGSRGPFFPSKAELMIVDSYALSAMDEAGYRNFAKKILVLDDLANRPHDCDILLDQTCGRMPGVYSCLVPPHCTILTGAEYALLRPQFALLREKTLESRNAEQGKINRILISLGSTDPHNIIPVVLKGVEELGLTIDVAIGSGARHLDSLKLTVDEMHERGMDVHLHVDAGNMAELIGRADLSIGAGGTTSWERCCLGLPTILIELADNQKAISGNLAAAGAVYNLGPYQGVTPEEITKAVTACITKPNNVLGMSSRAAAICDGTGMENLYRFLVHADIEIRPATLEDSRNMYEWRNNAEVRGASVHSDIIPYETHIRWFEDSLESPNRDLLIFEKHGTPFGILRFDYENNIAIISIYLAPHAIGGGMGAILLRMASSWLAINRQGVRAIHAEILENNTRSKKAFLGAGYRDYGHHLEFALI